MSKKGDNLRLTNLLYKKNLDIADRDETIRNLVARLDLIHDLAVASGARTIAVLSYNEEREVG